MFLKPKKIAREKCGFALFFSILSSMLICFSCCLLLFAPLNILCSILLPLPINISKILPKLDAKHGLLFCLIIGLVHLLLDLLELLDLLLLHLVPVLLFQLVISVQIAFFAQTLRVIWLIDMLALPLLLRFSFSGELFFGGRCRILGFTVRFSVYFISFGLLILFAAHLRHLFLTWICHHASTATSLMSIDCGRVNLLMSGTFRPVILFLRLLTVGLGVRIRLEVNFGGIIAQFVMTAVFNFRLFELALIRNSLVIHIL